MTRHLLWTGGWDSTYRLLEITLIHNAPVQPHYLLDPRRPSSSKELETIELIRQLLVGRGVQLPELLVTPITEVPPQAVNSLRFGALRSQAPIGIQYEWLSNYAIGAGLILELSVHEDDRAAVFLKDHVHRVDDEAGGYWELLTDVSDPLELFRAFRFPILNLTKLEMERRADEAGFGDVMELTWFCHSPKGGQPCGSCLPCQFTIEEGLGRRIPLRNRIAGTLIRLGKRARSRLGGTKTTG